MKKVFLFTCICCFLASIAFGQKLKGKLSYFSQDGQKFWVVINGKKINTEPAYEVPEFEVDGHWGKARIIFQNPQIPAIDKNWQVTDVDSNICSVKYMIKKNKKGKYDISNWDATFEVIGKPSTTVTNTTTVVNNTPSSNTQTTETTTVVKPVQPVEQTTTTTITTNTTGVNVNTNVNPTGVNLNVNGLGLNVTITDPNINNTETTTVTTTTKTNTTTNSSSTNTNIIAPNPNAKPSTNQTTTTTVPSTACVNAMTTADFADAKSSISSKPFEDNKIAIAKQIIKANCLSVVQIKEMIALFSFEDSKLDIAKTAYNKAIDKNNYYKINDVFSFSSSIDELNEFISTQK